MRPTVRARAEKPTKQSHARKLAGSAAGEGQRNKGANAMRLHKRELMRCWYVAIPLGLSTCAMHAASGGLVLRKQTRVEKPWEAAEPERWLLANLLKVIRALFVRR